MSNRVLISLGLLSAAWAIPGWAQDFTKFNFNAGGGISTPLNPTGSYAGVSGNFVAGAGYNIDKHNAIIGEFMWSGLPTNLFVLHPVNAPFGSINLYTLTANYRFQLDRLAGSRFGVYAIGGGGWYYRYAKVDKNYVVPGGTVCNPIYDWWGYVCGPGNFVYTQTIAYKGTNAGGLNGGVGFTIRLSDSGWKFYVESRYHYAWSNRIPTTLIPVTFGLRFN
jgi:Outer membrane protein beta-barrel domain